MKLSPSAAVKSAADGRNFGKIGQWDEKFTYKFVSHPLTLFTVDNYTYSVIVTNLPMTPYGVFTFYKDRAGLERIIRILKNDFPFAGAPTSQFCANALYAEISLLAYNLIMWFKRLCLPENWQSFTLATLRHKLLLMPGELVHTGNVHTLKFPRNSPNKDVFEFALNKIKKLKPLV